jgi:hypothetical protein
MMSDKLDHSSIKKKNKEQNMTAAYTSLPQTRGRRTRRWQIPGGSAHNTRISWQSLMTNKHCSYFFDSVVSLFFSCELCFLTKVLAY